MTDFSRADMHLHSTASARSRLGIQRSLSLPECATAPEEVYELARRRGMDFVTITDHDTIAGALEIAHLPGVFISEELTAWFRGEPQAVHVLCYGIDPDDHEWLQAHSRDLEACAAYLQAREITAALAHPFYTVAAPLSAAHRRRLAELFPIWETRNGSRAKELNLPAFIYIETRGGTAIGGSDDHGGIDIGRTYTQTPRADSPASFLAHVRRGRASAHGDQGSAAKWTHAAISLAIRSLAARGDALPPSPRAVLRIVERVLREGDARQGEAGGEVGPEDARELLGAWIAGMELEVDGRGLLMALGEGELGHADLHRRARRIHERRLAAVANGSLAGSDGREALEPRRLAGSDVREALEPRRLAGSDVREALEPRRLAAALFDACIPAIPYAAASAFLGRERSKLSRADGERPRVALIADGIGAMHGVSHTICQIRERGVPGFEIEVVGTDADVDRRLSAAAEIDVPFYRGLKVGVPSLPAVVEALADGRYDLVHLATPGPAGVAAWLLAHVLEMPRVASYHTELAVYASLRSGHAELGGFVESAMAGFYGQCALVLSPSPSTDERLCALGIPQERIGRWGRGVDLRRFDPALRQPGVLPGEISVLYCGRLSTEKGVDLLAETFLSARRADPRLHLVLAGGGPEEAQLRARLGEHASFLGWLGGEELARAYASADMFLFASRTDTYGQVILEAQASGLPVLAVAEGGPTSLIEHGETGLLAPPDPSALAERLLSLASEPLLCERIRRGALTAVRRHTWEASFQQLAAGYRRALADAAAERRHRVA